MMFTSAANSVIEHLPGVAFYTGMSMALALSAPIISRSGSAISKSALSLAVGILMAGNAPWDSSVDIFMLVISGMLIGAYLGFIFTIAFEMIQFASTLMSYSSQLGFANMVDANTGVQNSVMQRFIVHMAMLIFIGVGGIELMFTSMAMAPSPSEFRSFDLVHFINWSGLSFLFGLFMALPIMICGFLINLGMGIVTKSSPSMNVFSIGFPIVLLSSMLLLLIYVPTLFSSFNYYMAESLSRAL